MIEAVIFDIDGTAVRLETVDRRDLVATVTASGRIQPQTSVDVSSDITGRIIELLVKEGDMVGEGELLIRVDPATYAAAGPAAEAQRGEGSSA